MNAIAVLMLTALGVTRRSVSSTSAARSLSIMSRSPGDADQPDPLLRLEPKAILDNLNTIICRTSTTQPVLGAKFRAVRGRHIQQRPTP
jgi:hypothetical protein